MHRLFHTAVVAAAVALAGPGAGAQLACPKAVEAGKVITLSAPGGRTGVITWLDGGRVRIAEQHARAPRSFPRDTIAVRGLIGVDLAWPGNKAQLEFQAPVESVFPLVIGKEHALPYLARRAGQPPVKAQLTVAALEAVRHTIGACTYDALVVGSVSAFEDGTHTPVRYDVYIPTLQAVVKSTIFDGEGRGVLEQESFEYESITAR